MDRNKSKATFWTWPRKLAVLIVPLVAAWAVPYFAPGIVREIRSFSGDTFLTVTVLTADQFQSDMDHSNVKIVNAPLSELKGRDDGGAAGNVDAPDAGTTLVRLVARGTTDAEVTIQRIELVVSNRRPPARGIVKTGDKGSGVTPRHLQGNLDTGEVTWNTEPGRKTAPLALKISEKEEELIDFLAFSEAYPPSGKGCDCSWHLKLTYTVDGGEPQVTEVRAPGGLEFRTSSLGRASIWNLSDETCDDFPESPRLCDVDPSLDR